MRAGKALVSTLLLAFAALVFFVQDLEGACAVDPSIDLAVTKLSWDFNPRAGVLRLEAEVLNVSKSDVVGPGIAVALVDSEGKDLGSGVGRSRVSRIRPEERAEVKLTLKVAKIPGTIRVSPFQGVAGT